MNEQDLLYLIQRIRDLKLLDDPLIAKFIAEGTIPPFPGENPDIILASTRAPSLPLSGGMAPAMREATLGQKVLWYALGTRKPEPPEMRIARALALAAQNHSIPTDSTVVDQFKVKLIRALDDIRQGHYEKHSNLFVWFACHNLVEYAQQPTFWSEYANRHVNNMIARAISEDLRQSIDAFDASGNPDPKQDPRKTPIWFQDYLHTTMAGALRERGVTNPLIYFHHTPWPKVETLEAMGNHAKIIFQQMAMSLLECDAAVFQTSETARRFLKTLGYTNPPEIERFGGALLPLHDDDGKLIRNVFIGHAPISINTQKVMNIAQDGQGLQSDSARKLNAKLTAPNVIIGFERCDPSKGILPRVQAFKKLMEKRPDLRGKVQLMLVAEPSRTDIKLYTDYAEAVKRAAEEINATYGRSGEPLPVVFHNENVPNEDLLHMCLSTPEQRRISCVSPFEDGMNLTTKEFFAAQNLNWAGPGIVSAGVGAAAELRLGGRGALVYHPSETNDVTPLVDVLEQAIDMPQDEANARASRVQEHLKTHDIANWSRFHNNLFDDIRNGVYAPAMQASRTLSPIRLQL